MSPLRCGQAYAVSMLPGGCRHVYWRLWQALQAGRPWEYQHKCAFQRLRSASASDASEHGPPTALLDLLAATVTFRQICSCVQRQGMLWIPGSPSKAGLHVLRAFFPDAVFRFFRLPSGTVFTAAHPRCPREEWLPVIAKLGDTRCHSIQTSALRATFVYKTQSDNMG